MVPNFKNEFVGNGETKNEFCSRDTLAARSFCEPKSLQSWVGSEEAQDLSRDLHEDVEEDASAGG